MVIKKNAIYLDKMLCLFSRISSRVSWISPEEAVDVSTPHKQRGPHNRRDMQCSNNSVMDTIIICPEAVMI